MWLAKTQNVSGLSNGTFVSTSKAVDMSCDVQLWPNSEWNKLAYFVAIGSVIILFLYTNYTAIYYNSLSFIVTPNCMISGFFYYLK